jgi:hypothetical protein
MTIDRYTKCVLTVIALCLIWMSVGGPALLPTARAQSQGMEVVLTGWKDSSGVVWPLPTVIQPPTGAFVSDITRRAYQSHLVSGERLPVAVP